MTTEPTDPTPQIDANDREPLLGVGALATVVSAAIAALIAFGVHITRAQQVAVIALWAAIVPFITALVGRGRVYSPATVARLLVRASAARRQGLHLE